jgi:glycosyltransferase involved in cell wall biosynthesis
MKKQNGSREQAGSDKPITIMYLIDTYISPPDKASEGGTERQLYLIASSLDPVFFKPIVVQLFPFVSPSMVTGKVGAAEMLHFPTRKFYNLHGLHQIIRLILFAKREKVDIIHTFFEKSEVMGWLTARFSGVPVWITSRRDLGFKRKEVYKKIFKLAARDCSRCVANCYAIRNEVIEQEMLPDEKVEVIYNGLDFSRYLKPSDGNYLRGKLGIDNNVPIVGMIADINFEIKGHRHFLEAARIIVKTVPRVKFLLIGDGELRKGYEKMTQELGIEKNVFFLGKRSDIPIILSNFTVSVLCSTSEGLSNVILESMAAGKPVVATSVGGSPEMVVNGITGYLVPPADSDALARAIIILLRDEKKAKAMGEAGRRVAEIKFAVEKMVKSYERLYSSLISEICNK